MFDIHFVNDEYVVPDTIQKIDLDRDIIFAFMSDSKYNLNFDHSGIIKFGLGENTNLASIQNKCNPNSPLRNFKIKLQMKFCCPCGIAPIFMKPNNSKSILGIIADYKNYIDVKIKSNPIIGEQNFCSQKSVIYQNFNLDITFNRELLYKEYPSMILPKSFILFDLMLCQTIFSDTLTIGDVFVISNTEFFKTFKEAI